MEVSEGQADGAAALPEAGAAEVSAASAAVASPAEVLAAVGSPQDFKTYLIVLSSGRFPHPE